MKYRLGLLICCVVGGFYLHAEEPSFTLEISLPRNEFLPIQARKTTSKEVILPSPLDKSRWFYFRVVVDSEEGKKTLCTRGEAIRMPGYTNRAPLPEDTFAFTESVPYIFLEPGRYKVQAFYEHKGPSYGVNGEVLDIWEGRVESNRIPIEIKEPQGVDKEAYEQLLNWAAAEKLCGRHDGEGLTQAKICLYFKPGLAASDLCEKFPSSLYTAYALWERRKPNFAPIRGDKPATPQEIVESLLRNARNPVNEYRRSVRPGERKEEIEDLWHILKHQPEFVFLDSVYEALGLLYVEEQDLQKAQSMFEKAAGVTKDAKRKERMGAFVEAMKGRADKPEREAEEGTKESAEKQPE
jgi:hypothetical protein